MSEHFYPKEMKKQIMDCANEMAHLTDKYSETVILFSLLNVISKMALSLDLDKDKLAKALERTYEFHKFK